MIRTRRANAIPFKLLSVLLRYPDRRLVEAGAELAAIVDALPRSQREPLQRFVAYLAGQTQTELERQYVETFDLRRRSGLYLSYYVHGDTRKRGMTLLRLKRLYAAAGLELTSGELPDYLPLMLEFAALAPAGAGQTLLREYRPSLELLRASLRDSGSPYTDLLDALCDALPRLSALEREHIRLLGEQGPPEEQVGLQPFAPPEVMPTEARV
jgi:nitrate reductase molybdenum cofactor assembly chaperone NarJ/NarW